MQYKMYCTLFYCCFIFGIGRGQVLQRGQLLPEVKTDQLLNFPVKEFRLSDFKGKPLLLDFWSFNCGSCLKGFPKAVEIQEKLRDKANIVLVNFESRERTIQFFEKMKNMKTKAKMPKLPMITGDTVFRKLFPINGLPMVVWIDKDGRFRHCTGEFTEQQVLDFAAGLKPVIDEYYPKRDFKNKRPLFEQDNKAYLNEIRYYSYIAKYLEGSTIGSFHADKNLTRQTVRHSRNAYTITELVIDAYSEGGTKHYFHPDVNVVYNVNNRGKYIRPGRENVSIDSFIRWQENQVYRYDCEVPIEQKDRLFEYMRQDITRFFDLDVKIEKKITRCLVLEQIDDHQYFLPRGIKESDSYQKQLRDGYLDSIYFICEGFDPFFNHLKRDLYGYGVSLPIEMNIPYEGAIEMAFPYTEDGEVSFSFWTEQLARYGLRLTEREFETELLIITEKKFVRN